MRNHGLCEMRASKTAHRRWCSKERLFSNRNVHIMRQLTYHSDLMREPCAARPRLLLEHLAAAGALEGVELQGEILLLGLILA